MTKSICLDTTIEENSPSRGRTPHGIKIFLDACAFGKHYQPTKYRTAVTRRVLTELGGITAKISEESIAHVGYCLQPNVVEHGLSSTERNFIRLASSKFTGRRDRDYISETDAEQIALVMFRARKQRESILVTEDRKMLRVAERIAKMSPSFGSYVTCVSTHGRNGSRVNAYTDLPIFSSNLHQ